jgi:hypothetical protein
VLALHANGKSRGQKEVTLDPEDVFQSANERIAEKARELGWDRPFPLLCECSDIRCFTRLELTLEAYKEARLHRQRYLVAPGHQVTGAVASGQDRGVAFVEKHYAST